MKTGLALLIFAVLLANYAVAHAGDAAKKFKITTKRANDAIGVEGDKNRTVFNVKSPFGISQASTERLEDDWPQAVIVRLHLKGLENFKVSSGTIRVDGAVSIQQGKTQVRLWKDGKEDALLDEKSPLWIPIRAMGADGKPADALPLKDGFFELTLPRPFFEGNPKSISLSWIDFYRQ